MDYSNKTENDLIALVKDNSDSKAYLELSSRVEKLYFNVCHKYSKPLIDHGIDFKDILEQKDAIIYFCVNNFDVKRKSKFSTYVGNYARFLCLNSINARKLIMPSSDDEIAAHIENTQICHNYNQKEVAQEEYNAIYNLIDQFQDKRISEIFRHRYLGDKKMVWAEVAKKVGLSSQTCIALGSRGLKILKYKIKSKNILENFE